LPKTIVHVRTMHESSTAVGWAGNRTLTIDRPHDAGGMGLGYNGGELLFLAIGACYTNDIFREASKRGINVKSVQVDVEGEWGGDPVRAQNVMFFPKVEADASDKEIMELIHHTDRVAEVHNSLRMGTQVTLADPKALKVNK
jgi:organic hydroperoxide reductase OsmC/OhrA